MNKNKCDNHRIVEMRGSIVPDILSVNGQNQIVTFYPNGREVIYDKIRCDGKREVVRDMLLKILESWPDDKWDIGYFQATLTMTADLKKSKD